MGTAKLNIRSCFIDIFDYIRNPRFIGNWGPVSLQNPGIFFVLLTLEVGPVDKHSFPLKTLCLQECEVKS